MAKTVKGIFTDTTANDTPEGYSVFAKNLILTEKLGSILNEKGFILSNILSDKVIIGAAGIDDNILVFLVNPTTGVSEIGELINYTGISNIYSKIIDDNDLLPAGSKFNFSVNAPILSEYYKNYKSERIVAWIDDINPPRIINLDNSSFEINDLNLFPTANLPTPEVPYTSVNDTGGGLLTGAYRIAYQLEDDDGTLSAYSATTAPISIFRGSSGSNPQTIWGDEGGLLSSKSILITIRNTDPNWKFVRIIAIKNIKNVLSVVQIKKIALSTVPGVITTPGVYNIAYTGTETETTLTLEEFLTDRAFYTNAKAITQLNNKLYLANLTTVAEESIQRYCMNIQVRWRSTLVQSDSAPFKATSGQQGTTFMHGEAYALYLQPRYKSTGDWGKIYHIPGRQFSSGDTTTIAPGLTGLYRSGAGSPSFEKYQLEDTVSGPFVVTSGYNGLESIQGTMGYWKNQNESYPDDDNYNGSVDANGTQLFYNNMVTNALTLGRNLKGTRVLHHKFPTLKYLQSLHSPLPGPVPYGDDGLLSRLTIDVKLPRQFDSTYNGIDRIPNLDDIIGWRILYAKRDINNATVIGSSHIYFFGQGKTSREQKPIVSNTQLSRSNADNNISCHTGVLSSFTGRGEFIKFHAFNLMVDKPGISPTYLRQEIKYTWNLGGDGNNNTTGPLGPRLITGIHNLDDASKWFLFSTVSNITPAGGGGISQVATIDRFRNVNFLQYLPNGAIINTSGFTINNNGGEDCVLLKANVNGFGTTLSQNEHRYLHCASSAAHPAQWQDNSIHMTTLSTLCNLKSDVYTSFLDQEVLATDKEVQKDYPTANYLAVSLNDIGGGDCFVGMHSVHMQGPVSDARLVETAGEALTGGGCRALHEFPAVSPKNPGGRYSSVSDTQSIFYPQTNLLPPVADTDLSTRYFGIQDINKTPVYLYNNDYSTRNDLITKSIFNINDIVETRFPTTIVTSQTFGNESTAISWRTFLSNDRYTMPRNRGQIINLQAVANQKLFIHQEDSLFITKDRTVLKGNIEDITIGTGSIFDITPYEVVSTEQGYAGTKHKFGCVLTKVGYAFVDASQGKVFLHNGEQLDEISKRGLRQFWRDNVNSKLPDNPFTGNGITIGYDELYNRLLVTVNDAANNKFITASYSPQLESWCSFHDYAPGYYIPLRANRLFSIKNNNITTPVYNTSFYEHNIGNYGRYYQQDGTLYPLIVDLVYNNNSYEVKYFTAVGWTTQVFDSNNNFIKDETVDYVTVRSDHKTTGRIEIEKYTNAAEIYNSNTRLTETTWSFNKLRNIAISTLNSDLTLGFYNNYNINPIAINTNKDWYEQGRMIDRYIITRLEYSNLNNNKFLLLDHNSEYRKSYRN